MSTFVREDLRLHTTPPALISSTRCTHPLTLLTPRRPFAARRLPCLVPLRHLSSGSAADRPANHTHGRAEHRITFGPFFSPLKRLPTQSSARRRQAACPRRASGRVRSCLMGSAQWVMGHKFKRSAKLTESPALLSSPPTLMRASSCAAPVKLKSLLGAGRPGPHLCECLKQLFLWLWWKTFSQKPSWLLPCGQETLAAWWLMSSLECDVWSRNLISFNSNTNSRWMTEPT